jgi:hypothetical protein
MRTLAILILVAGFTAVVCLPNEIGTHDLPAVGGKVIAKARQQQVDLPQKGGPVACLMAVELQDAGPFSLCRSKVWRSGRTAAIVQINLPLLI